MDLTDALYDRLRRAVVGAIPQPWLQRVHPWAAYPVVRLAWIGRTFRFGDSQLPYLVRSYNITWRNERAVEIPLIDRWLRGVPFEDVLEVGNVLSHYGRGGHQVVDKYERAPGVLNADVIDFHPDKRYSLIVSISTLEHVGWDEEPRDPDKAVRAIRHLRGLLRPEGRLVFTFPAGYNSHLHAAVLGGGIDVAEVHCFRRVTPRNRWAETTVADARRGKYDDPFPGTNAVVLAVIAAREGG